MPRLSPSRSAATVAAGLLIGLLSLVAPAAAQVESLGPPVVRDTPSVVRVGVTTSCGSDTRQIGLVLPVDWEVRDTAAPEDWEVAVLEVPNDEKPAVFVMYTPIAAALRPATSVEVALEVVLPTSTTDTTVVPVVEVCGDGTTIVWEDLAGGERPGVLLTVGDAPRPGPTPVLGAEAVDPATGWLWVPVAGGVGLVVGVVVGRRSARR